MVAMITVLEAAEPIAAILDADPGDRTELLRRLLEPLKPMYRFAPMDVDLVQMHQLSFGFPLDRHLDESRAGLQQLVDADAWGRLQRGMDDGLAALHRANPELVVPDITVLLMLGDPGDAHFVDEVKGQSGFGGISGQISITVWPGEHTLHRVEAIGVHELHHNVRYSPGGVVWDPATVTAGEQIIGEGLADAFACELYGDSGHSPIGVPHLADDAVLARVVEGLEVTGMENFPAWVLGDATAARFGAEPVGLPTGAGYAAGYRLVDAWRRATGKTAAEGVWVDGREIIDVALAELGLP